MTNCFNEILELMMEGIYEEPDDDIEVDQHALKSMLEETRYRKRKEREKIYNYRSFRIKKRVETRGLKLRKSFLRFKSNRRLNIETLALLDLQEHVYQDGYRIIQDRLMKKQKSRQEKIDLAINELISRLQLCDTDYIDFPDMLQYPPIIPIMDSDKANHLFKKVAAIINQKNTSPEEMKNYLMNN